SSLAWSARTNDGYRGMSRQLIWILLSSLPVQPVRDQRWEQNMQFKQGIREWRGGMAKIAGETAGIERAVGIGLYVLTLTSPTEWLHMGYDLRKKSSWIDVYVFVTLLFSMGIFATASVGLAILSTYFSASAIIVLLNIVLLQRVFG